MTDDGKNYAYVYDAFGRLVGVKNRSTSAAVTNHRYNGLGYRIMWQYDADATLEDAERYYLTYDERWRVVAAFRNQDSSPKEAFVFHGSGVGGRGGSSYIDSVILRDRDANGGGGWTGASDGTLEERRFYCQNWRADVVAVMESGGDPVEWVRYSAYGEATAFPVADVNRDGVVNSTDQSDWSTLYSGGTTCAVPVDLNFDGIWPDSTDNDVFTASYNATTGSNNKGKVSTVGVDNRLGYAGYHFDPATSHYHVRHRVYMPALGRWTRRDPLGHVDGASTYAYCHIAPVARFDPDGRVAYSCELGGYWGFNQILVAAICVSATTDIERCAPLRNESACAAAKRCGLDKGDFGGIICLGTTMLTCFWAPGSGPGGTPGPGDDIFEGCVLEHEKDHREEVSCTKCPPGEVCRPGRDNPGTKPAEECKAYKIEIACYDRRKGECDNRPDAQQCRDNVSAQRTFACEEAKRNCGSYPAGCP